MSAGPDRAALDLPAGATPEQEVTLLELLDRVLDKGVVLSGDITLSVADVDLVYVGLRLLLSSTATAERLQRELPAHHVAPMLHQRAEVA